MRAVPLYWLLNRSARSGQCGRLNSHSRHADFLIALDRHAVIRAELGRFLKLLDAFAEQPDAQLIPAEFARTIDEPVAQVSYHFRVLARNGEIEAIDDDPQVGPSERVYRLPSTQPDAPDSTQ